MKTKYSVIFLAFLSLVLASIACSTTSSPSAESLGNIEIGQSIIQEGFAEYNLESVMIFDEFGEEYIAYDPKQGLKRLVFIFYIKNLNSNEIKVDDFVKINITYQDNFKYEISEYIKSGEISFFNTSLTLTPLQNTKIYCIIEIPDDVALSKDSIKTVIELGKEKYQYTGSIDSAYEYIATMKQIHEKTDEVLWEIGTITTDMSFAFQPQQSDLIEFAQRFSAQKQILTDVSSQLATISYVPSLYQEGHQNYLQGINLFLEALTYLSDESVISDDLSIYSNNLRISSELIINSETYIDKAKELLTFLSW